MDPTQLVPSPDAIPAPAWLFQVLDVVFFFIHITLINIILGGSILLFASRFRQRADSPVPAEVLAHKLPVLFALAINMGVAPLLFMQVIYGHLFYSSSVLMGVYWILVIPLVIIAYYAAYIQARSVRSALVTAGLGVMVIILLYVGFTFTNNLLLSMQPAKWEAYFGNRAGTILNATDPTFIPRYLHFVIASLAIAGLAAASLWAYRERGGNGRGTAMIRNGLRVFGIATLVQIPIGFWFLVALPREIILQFMGRDPVATVILALGFLSGIGAIVSALRGKLRPTIMQIAVTMITMVVTRDQLRTMYLHGQFSTANLSLAPQYGVLALFVIILVAGAAAIAWMLNAGFGPASRRDAQ